MKGQILFQGKPLPRASVTFHRDPHHDDAGTPFGVTDADGQFQLTTFKPNDGCPAGDYLVTVSCTKSPNPNSSDPDDGPQLLPKKFLMWDTTPLKATVLESETTLEPFEIKP